MAHLKGVAGVILACVVNFSLFSLAWAGPPLSLKNDPDFLVWLLGILLAAFAFANSIIGWMLSRHIRQNDENNRMQWAEMRELKQNCVTLDRDLLILQTEHRLCPTCQARADKIELNPSKHPAHPSPHLHHSHYQFPLYEPWEEE